MTSGWAWLQEANNKGLRNGRGRSQPAQRLDRQVTSDAPSCIVRFRYCSSDSSVFGTGYRLFQSIWLAVRVTFICAPRARMAVVTALQNPFEFRQAVNLASYCSRNLCHALAGCFDVSSVSASRTGKWHDYQTGISARSKT